MSEKTREKQRLAVVGTRGVPARYGGFETMVEHLARSVNPEAVELSIYGEKSSYRADERRVSFMGHRTYYLPIRAHGAWSLLHDALQLLAANFRDRHDRILILGVSAAWVIPLIKLCSPECRIFVNLDGIEWRREKFGRLATSVLRVLERIAVRWSDRLVTDNDALASFVETRYGVTTTVIAYGGDHVHLLEDPDACPKTHMLAIARVEPENNTDIILEAASRTGIPMKFIGNWEDSTFGKGLVQRYRGEQGVELIPPEYDSKRLSPFRTRSFAYIHGHSVGGTNPSLVEALYHSDRILAFDCPFNRSTLGGAGAYWKNVDELVDLMHDENAGKISMETIMTLRQRYTWKAVSSSYIRMIFPAAPMWVHDILRSATA